MRKFNAIKNAVNFGKGKNTMNKFNEQKQIEETTLYETGELMSATNEDKYVTEYKRTFTHVDENWTCTIDEHIDQSEYPKFVATFEDKLSSEVHARRCGTVKRAGEWLVDCLEHHYEVIVPQHDLGNDNFATRQLEAEDAIDTHETEYGFFLSKRG